MPPSSDARRLVYHSDHQALSTAQFRRVGQLATAVTCQLTVASGMFLPHCRLVQSINQLCIFRVVQVIKSFQDPLVGVLFHVADLLSCVFMGGWRCAIQPMMLGFDCVQWVDCIKYLGVHVCSGKNLAFDVVYFCTHCE